MLGGYFFWEDVNKIRCEVVCFLEEGFLEFFVGLIRFFGFCSLSWDVLVYVYDVI